MQKAVYVLSMIISFCYKAGAESKHDHFFVSAQYHYQYIWKHFSGMGDEVNNPAKSYEINMGWKTSGALLWHQLYNQPSYGIGFYFCDLNNPKVYGEVRSGFLFMEFPFSEIFSTKSKLKVSLGLAHFNRYYDSVSNPLNLNIGNSLNVHFNLNYSLFFRLSDRLLLAPGLSFTHFSNGAYKKPNRGFNLFDVNLALRHNTKAPVTARESIVNEEKSPFIRKQKLFMVYSIGFMQRDVGDPTYMARSLTINHTLQTGPRGRWGIGIDLSYDDHSRELIRQESDDYGYKEYFRLGGYASHDIIFDRLSVLLNLGTYLYYGVSPDSKFFSRIGLRYSLGRNLHAQLALKAHRGRADHVQWGIGYSL